MENGRCNQNHRAFAFNSKLYQGENETTNKKGIIQKQEYMTHGVELQKSIKLRNAFSLSKREKK